MIPSTLNSPEGEAHFRHAVDAIYARRGEPTLVLVFAQGSAEPIVSAQGPLIVDPIDDLVADMNIETRFRVGGAEVELHADDVGTVLVTRDVIVLWQKGVVLQLCTPIRLEQE
jgi:hypothetical protein